MMSQNEKSSLSTKQWDHLINLYSSLLALAEQELYIVRRERKALENKEANGVWFWSDSDPNEIESMSEDMVVSMRAAQLRDLIRSHSSWTNFKTELPPRNSKIILARQICLVSNPNIKTWQYSNVIDVASTHNHMDVVDGSWTHWTVVAEPT